MTNYKALSIFNSLKPFTVGYDDLFSHFDEMTTHLPHLTANNFPPYNIVKHDSNKYDVEMALAGYSKDDVIEEDWAEFNLYLGIVRLKWRWF